MAGTVIAVIISLVACVMAMPYPVDKSNYSYPFSFVSRAAWGARDPTSISLLGTPVSLVIIHHSFIPPDCYSQDACKQSMRAMQNAHQLVNGWIDIGYNFAVGGEGSVFEGRGWNHVGAHAAGYNTQSIGIVMIGDFISKLPTASQLQSVKQLISAGVQLGYISPEYRLIGHRQVTATECPGQEFFNELTTWDHFDSNL